MISQIRRIGFTLACTPAWIDPGRGSARRAAVAQLGPRSPQVSGGSYTSGVSLPSSFRLAIESGPARATAVGQLTNLRRLMLDHNQLSALP
jgi:hypothetical protein